ncbi:MAG: hypothetical protein JSR42_19020 [Proteobacteria bacterium]|nr:hypothetical protein [Pseudomonadota bacterium]
MAPDSVPQPVWITSMRAVPLRTEVRRVLHSLILDGRAAPTYLHDWHGHQVIVELVGKGRALVGGHRVRQARHAGARPGEIGAQHPLQEGGAAQRLDPFGEVDRPLVAAIAIDLMAAQAVLLSQSGGFRMLRSRARRQQGVQPCRRQPHLLDLIWPEGAAFDTQLGVPKVVPNQVPGAESDVLLVLQAVVDAEGVVSGTFEYQIGAILAEALGRNPRDVAVERAELDLGAGSAPRLPQPAIQHPLRRPSPILDRHRPVGRREMRFHDLDHDRRFGQ